MISFNNNFNFLYLSILLIFESSVITSQVNYLSPVPGSKYNNPRTNIILKLEAPIIKKENISEVFQISGKKNKIYPYSTRLINESKTILLIPIIPFGDFDSIQVKLIDTLFFKNSILIDLNFEFQISYQSKPENNPDKKSGLKKDLSSEIPLNFPKIKITVNNNPSTGKIFLYNVSSMASSNDRYISIINDNGVPEYWRQENNKGLGFTLQPSGYLSFWNEGNFVLIDSSYHVIDTIGCGNGYTADFHEFIYNKEGHSFLLSWDLQPIDMSKIIAGGDPEALAEGLIIQELDKDENVIFQWRSWDHYKITDAVDIDLRANDIRYVHGNSLCVTNDGNLLLSSRILNEITKINRTTGEIIWRFGGKNNQFLFTNDPEMFCRQHYVRELENGNIILYDNGTCHIPQITSVKEYKLDIEKKTAELVWSFHHPSNMYCSTMGSAQRLSNGNTFINWGFISNPALPSMTEVKPDGSIAFELNFNGQYQQIYRSFRFEWENDINTSGEIINHDINDFTIFPNPVSEKLNIKTGNNYQFATYLRITNVFGKLILTKNLSPMTQIHDFSIDIENFSNGIYFLTLGNPEFSKTKIFLKSIRN